MIGETIYRSDPIKLSDLGSKENKDKDRKKNEAYKHRFNESLSLIDELVFTHNVSYLCSTFKEKKRHKSLKPLIYNKITKYQKQIANRHKDKKNLLPKVSFQKAGQLAIEKVANEDKTLINIVYVNTKEERDDWLNTRSLLQKYRPSIKEHLLRRIEHFLLQLTSCCFGTGFIFKVGKTHHQAVSASQLFVNCNGKQKFLCKRNAAHGSTFPSLIAYDKKDKKKKITVLPYTYTYTRMNSTMALPDCINRADISIDGGQHNSDFSNTALKILNEASQRKIMPVAAMKEFMKALTDEISQAKSGNDDTKEALRVFHSEMKGLNKLFKKNLKTWVFRQVDLSIDKNTSKKQSNVMLEIRMKAMRRDVIGQAKIMNRVYILANKVLDSIMENEVKTPDNYYVIFKKILIETMKGKDRRRLQKLFNLNLLGISRCRATSSKIRKKASKELKELASRISQDMRRLRKEERKIQGKSMRMLRESKNITLKELSRELKSTKLDSQKIRQIENNTTTLDPHNAKQIARALNVPRVLLVNQSFFS